MRKSNIYKEALNKQIAFAQNLKQLETENKLLEEREYLLGWRTAKDNRDFRHRTGNIGQLASQTAKEQVRLKVE